MKDLRIEFSECEHDGDLRVYLNDLTESGAIILDSVIDDGEETALVNIRVVDVNDFLKKFKMTDSHGFSSLDI